MMTIKEFARLCSCNAQTLRYYDKIGLLHPSGRTEAGYRLYGGRDLQRLQRILLFRAVEFPLREIKAIMEDPDFDRTAVLEQQIELLTLEKEHIENLISLARGIKLLGENYMNFTAFDRKKLDDYAREAKAAWGNTAAHKEFEEKKKGRSEEKEQALGAELMAIFAELGRIRHSDPAAEEAQRLVKKLQDFIGEHYYTCTDTILLGLGKMYAAGGEFTENIDRCCGEGTAVFVCRAIEAKCAAKGK